MYPCLCLALPPYAFSARYLAICLFDPHLYPGCLFYALKLSNKYLLQSLAQPLCLRCRLRQGNMFLFAKSINRARMQRQAAQSEVQTPFTSPAPAARLISRNLRLSLFFLERNGISYAKKEEGNILLQKAEYNTGRNCHGYGRETMSKSKIEMFRVSPVKFWMRLTLISRRFPF